MLVSVFQWVKILENSSYMEISDLNRYASPVRMIFEKMGQQFISNLQPILNFSTVTHYADDPFFKIPTDTLDCPAMNL